jgi:hypothetical protein
MVIDDDDDGIVFDLSVLENDIGAFSVSKMV